MQVKLFVSSLPSDVTEKELIEQLNAYANIVSVKLVKDKKHGFCVGFGNIFVSNQEEAAILQNSRVTFRNRVLKIDPFLTGKHLESKQQDLYSRRIFVKQIPKKIKEKNLKHIFSKYGKVHKAHFLHKNSETVTSCAVITFEKSSSAYKCLKTKNLKIPGNEKLVPCFPYNPKLKCKDNENNIYDNPHQNFNNNQLSNPSTNFSYNYPNETMNWNQNINNQNLFGQNDCLYSQYFFNNMLQAENSLNNNNWHGLNENDQIHSSFNNYLKEGLFMNLGQNPANFSLQGRNMTISKITKINFVQNNFQKCRSNQNQPNIEYITPFSRNYRHEKIIDNHNCWNIRLNLFNKNKFFRNIAINKDSSDLKMTK